MHRGWLERESRYGLQPGHNWFIISMQWWQQWKEYVKYVSKCPAYLHLCFFIGFLIPSDFRLLLASNKMFQPRKRFQEERNKYL